MVADAEDVACAAMDEHALMVKRSVGGAQSRINPRMFRVESFGFAGDEVGSAVLVEMHDEVVIEYVAVR